MRLLFLFFNFLFILLSSIAQPTESDTVGVIYIGFEEEKLKTIVEQPKPSREKVTLSYPADDVKDVFEKNMYIYRLDLQHIANVWIKEITCSANLFDKDTEVKRIKTGLIPAIITGIQQDKIIALSPSNKDYRFTYSDYVQQLTDWESQANIIPAKEDTNTYNPFAEFATPICKPKALEKKEIRQNLSMYEHDMCNKIDFVIEKGIQTQDSRPYFRIRFVQLLWYNPQIHSQAQIMAIIPYYLLQPYFEQMYVHDRNHASGTYNVRQYLDMGNFQGQVIPIR